MTPEQHLVISQTLKRLRRAGVRSVDAQIAAALKRAPVSAASSAKGSSVSSQSRSTNQLNSRHQPPAGSPTANPGNSPPISASKADQTQRTNSPAPTTSSATPKGQPLVVGNGNWTEQALTIAERQSTLAEMQNNALQCVQCPALQNRQSVVFGEGAADSRVAFFGEAPDENEDAQGRPFVGDAGSLLDKIILAAKLSRDQIYILNSVKCRPLGKRNPTDDEIENCRPFFARQLEIVQPEYIVCWGTIAAKTILGYTGPLGKIRGTFHRYHGAKVMVTYHPGYLLRDQRAKHKTWEDIQMLMRDMGIT